MDIPAGWYPDPAGDTTKIRYWDGQVWTDQTQPVVNPELVGNTAPAPGTGLPGQPMSTPMQPIYTPGQEIPAYGTVAAPTTDRKGFALASLIIGIAGFLLACLAYLNFIPALLGIIFGVLGLKSSRKGMAIAGLILGVVAIVLGILMTLLYFDIYQNPMNYGLSPDEFRSLGF
jgi:hypothetical protein